MIYEKLKTVAIAGITIAFALGMLWLIFKFALPIALPFAIAYALSSGIRRLASRLKSKTDIKESFLQGWLLFLGLGGILLILGLAAGAIFRELTESLNSLSLSLKGEGSMTMLLSKAVCSAGEKLGLSREITDSATALITSALSDAGSLAANLGGSFISSLPKIFFAAAVGILSLFYFTFGRQKAYGAVISLIPESNREAVCSAASRGIRGIGRFARAYLLIMAFTAAELFTGFLLLGIDHALILALCISLVDVFPVLGVGTVLFPWAAICLLSGNTGRAIGLIMLLAAISILRQPIESRLVGKTAGVHPVLILAAVYAGYYISGVFGMIAAPLLLGVAAAVKEERGER